jgi:hypothetical protein
MRPVTLKQLEAKLVALVPQPKVAK